MVFAEQKTHYVMKEILKKNKINVSPSYISFSDWEDFLVLSRNIESNDLIILNSSPKRVYLISPHAGKKRQLNSKNISAGII